MTILQTAEQQYPERTQRQPLTWFCGNSQCIENFPKRFEFTSDKPVCPKCGCEGPPGIQLRALVHLSVPDPNGQIRGRFGRYKIACEPKRTHQTTGKDAEAVTDSVDAANCPECLKFAKRSRIVNPLGERIRLVNKRKE